MIPGKRKHLLDEDAGNRSYDGSGNGRYDDFDAKGGTLHSKRARTNLSDTGNDYQSSNEGRHSRDRAIRIATHWRSLGEGTVFGSGDIGGHKNLPELHQVSGNMRTSYHGWKYQAGYWIPFFGIVLQNPLAFLSTCGTRMPPKHIVRWQKVNPVLDSRYHFSISLRDADRGGKNIGVVFLHLTVKNELLRDCRKGYILADLALIMGFLEHYQLYLAGWTNRDRYPAPIDVMFESWLVKHPELPHPRNHIIPVIHQLYGSTSDSNVTWGNRRFLGSAPQSNHGFESLVASRGITNVDGRSIRPSRGSTPPNGPRYPTSETSFTGYKPSTGRTNLQQAQHPWVHQSIDSTSVAPTLSSSSSAPHTAIRVASANSSDALISDSTWPITASVTPGTTALSSLGNVEPLREKTMKAFKITVSTRICPIFLLYTKNTLHTGRRMRELYDNRYTKDELIAEFSKDNGIFAADSPAALSLTIRRYLRERYDGKGSNEEILTALAEDFLVFPKELGP